VISAVTEIKPATPASISVPATSTSTNFTVSWSATNSADTYYVQRQKKVSGSWVNSGTEFSTANTSKAYSNHADGYYRYRVRAYHNGKFSAYKTSGQIHVEKTPAIPSGISSPAESSSKTFAVSWNAVTPVNTYELQWRTGSNAFATIQTGLTQTQAGVTVVYNGTHDFRVRACRSLSCSGYSAITSTFVFTGGWGGFSAGSESSLQSSDTGSCDSEQPTPEQIANQPPPTVTDGVASPMESSTTSGADTLAAPGC
jgi:hypothetical protein